MLTHTLRKLTDLLTPLGQYPSHPLPITQSKFNFIILRTVSLVKVLSLVHYVALSLICEV